MQQHQQHISTDLLLERTYIKLRQANKQYNKSVLSAVLNNHRYQNLPPLNKTKDGYPVEDANAFINAIVALSRPIPTRGANHE